MLNYIRNNTQSWGIKIAFGIIILVFVFWGLGSVQNLGRSAVVAKVNGQAILQHDFLVQYQNAEENIRLNNTDITQEQLNNMGIGHRVLQKMIIDTLLQEESRRIGLAITPRELLKTIEKIPSFHNAQGKFDKKTYLNVLDAQRVSPGLFEADISKSLLEEKLKNQVTGGTYILASTIKALYNFSREQRIVEYVYFPASDYQEEAVSADDINNYYENNKNLFTIPAQLKIEYILLSSTELGEKTKLSEEEISDYYTKNQTIFTSAAQADVSHILILLAENAEPKAVSAAEFKMSTALEELSQGKKFEDVAKKYSEDTVTASLGGNLGFIKKNDTVKEFDAMAFSLKENAVSGIVRTSFGLHLIKLHKLEAAQIKELDEVRDDIITTLKLQAGNDKIYTVLDFIVEGNIVGTPLSELAVEYELKAETSDLLSFLEIQEELNISDKDAQLLMQGIEGSAYDIAIESLDGNFIVAKILQSKPAAIEQLADVKDAIIMELKAEQGLKAALSKGNEIRKNMGTELPAEYKSKIQVSTVINRGQSIPNFENNREISTAIFTADQGMWLPSAFQVYSSQSEGVVLLRVKDIVSVQNTDWSTIEKVLTESVHEARKNEVFNMFITSLMSKAEIDIENQAILNGPRF